MTHPLTPKAVAQMVAKAEKMASHPGGTITDPLEDLVLRLCGSLTTLAAENATLRAERDAAYVLAADAEKCTLAVEAHNATLREEAARMDIAFADVLQRRLFQAARATAAEEERDALRASEAAARERVAELEVANRSALDSRSHFKISAGRQKERCHKLRHRQRALLSALEAIRLVTSLDDAKFKANVAIGGWSDDELIYNARARALTPTTNGDTP